MEPSSLTTDERGKLNEQIRRAQQFEQQEDIDLMRQPLEGLLMKFTNAFQGYQPRWFVLDPARAELSYYLKEEHRHSKRPRGILNLHGATIIPSEEDSLAFTVCPAIGEPYRLTAANTKQKTEWINRMRTASEEQSERRLRDALREHIKTPAIADPIRHGVARETAVLHNIHKILSVMSDQLHVLNKAIDALPETGSVTHSNSHILTLKALAQAEFSAIEQSWIALNNLQSADVVHITAPATRRKSINRRDDRAFGTESSAPNSLPKSHPDGKSEFELANVHVAGHERAISNDYNEETEVETGPPFMESDLGSVESQKSVILTLLSRLGLGTDLTRITLPIFVLQSRSMLEMFSDFFANTPYFVKIGDPDITGKVEDRLAAIVKWFLTSFYFGCKGALPRKPYNPALGEIYRCTWESSSGSGAKVRFVAEQVSHHPPVSAFYASCKEKGIYLNGCISPKSQYMGTSISATMVGQVKLIIMGPNDQVETYRITLPTCFACSILTTPWIELGGKCTISCLQRPEVFATVTFHTKPFYGGKVHRVTGDIKSNGHISCRFQGEWNRQLEFQYEKTHQSLLNEKSNDYYVETLDVPGMDWSTRRIRPLEKQDPRESRRLWRNVTEALRRGDYELAAQEKQRVEQMQRNEGSRDYTPIFFEKIQCSTTSVGPENVCWVHKEMPDSH